MTEWDDQAHKPDISTLNEPKTNSAPESRLYPHQLPLPSCGALSSNPVLRSLFPKHNFITYVVANPPIRSVCHAVMFHFLFYHIRSSFAISYKVKKSRKPTAPLTITVTNWSLNSIQMPVLFKLRSII